MYFESLCFQQCSGSPEQDNVEMGVRVFSYLDRLCNHAAPTYECRLYEVELLSW